MQQKRLSMPQKSPIEASKQCPQSPNSQSNEDRMSFSQLSKELASLVHHVELSKEGWRDRALELIVLAVLQDHGRSCSREELLSLLNERLPSPLGRAQVESLVHRLQRTGTLLEEADGAFRLSEATYQDVTQQRSLAADLENRVRAKFETHFRELIESQKITWEVFERGFLSPLVSELGAHTYEFLAGKEADLADAGTFIAFIRSFPENSHSTLSQAITTLLDHRDPDVRTYIFRLLNASFLVQATALSQVVLDSVSRRATGKPLRLNAIVDTNFLFSLLGLHENPADDVVEALGKLVAAVRERLDVRLYILPITVDEARRTLGVYESSL